MSVDEEENEEGVPNFISTTDIFRIVLGDPHARANDRCLKTWDHERGNHFWGHFLSYTLDTNEKQNLDLDGRQAE